VHSYTAATIAIIATASYRLQLMFHNVHRIVTYKHLQAVIPQSAVEHVTLRLTEGKAVLVGGLAKIELISGKPFLFTFFISNQVSMYYY
jgi:hypothetical protein